MPRYKGTVTQSILDWYAAQAMAGQQWFTGSTPNYWAFSLLNNATDGRRLWVYDAETVSGAAFPAGTGNPNGNPNAGVGYQGGGGTPATWALVSHSNSIVNGAQSLVVVAPTSIAAGNLIILFYLSGGFAASFINPPDATWIRLASADGNANSPSLNVFAHIATGSEPGSWTFTSSSGVNSQHGAIVGQFSGNVNPVAVDVSASRVAAIASTSIVSPALVLTSPGDLVFDCFGMLDQPQTVLNNDPTFTTLDSILVYGQRFLVGYKTVTLIGPVGPFTGTTAPADRYAAISVAMKAANAGSSPAQNVGAPIASVSPIAPGIFTLGFSGTPLAFPGITRWIPPASHFEWHREAPIAVLQSGDQFNLAGISPENAAWGSVTWIAIK